MRELPRKYIYTYPFILRMRSS